MKNQTLSVIQLCQRSGVNLNQRYKLIYCGRIKAEKRGGRWIIDPESAERFLQRCRFKDRTRLNQESEAEDEQTA